MAVEKVTGTYDPFSCLPPELVDKLFTFLTPAERIALMRASAQLIRPRVLLQHASKPLNFFAKPKTVRTSAIPSKPGLGKDDLKDTYITQLCDGRLLYCYSDGTIGLFSKHADAVTPEFIAQTESLLPECKIVYAQDLGNNHVLICTEDHQAYRLNLTTKVATQQHLPAVKVCSVLAVENDMAYFGMEDGRLIFWNFKENSLMNSWRFFARSSQDGEGFGHFSIENLKKNSESQKDTATELAIVRITRNIDGQLFMVFDVENGYLTGLFDMATLSLSRLKCILVSRLERIASEVNQVFYNRFGDIAVVLKTATGLEIRDNSSPPQFTTIFNDRDESILESAFALPDGTLAFSCYQERLLTDSSDLEIEDNADICQLEIQQFHDDAIGVNKSMIAPNFK